MNGDPHPDGHLNGNYWFDHLCRVENSGVELSIMEPLNRAQIEFLRNVTDMSCGIFRMPAHPKVVQMSLEEFGWVRHIPPNQYAKYGILRLPWEVVLR
jgi:hypothetical protein